MYQSANLELFCKSDFLPAHFRRALDMSQITCKSGSNLQNEWSWRDFSGPYRACYVTLMHNQDWSLEGITVDLWYLKWWGTLVHIDPCMCRWWFTHRPILTQHVYSPGMSVVRVTFPLLAPQSGALRISAYRDFQSQSHPIPSYHL